MKNPDEEVKYLCPECGEDIDEEGDSIEGPCCGYAPSCDYCGYATCDQSC